MEDQYQPDWDAYFCMVDDKPASIAVDLDLRRFAPLPEREYFIQISVRVQYPDENGLPMGKELERLSEIEDALSCNFGEKPDAVFVGRSAFHGFRNFYFYSASTDDVASVITNSISDFDGYSAELEISHEPEWETYFEFLLPDAREFQRMQNRKLLEQLESYGDDPEIKRLVEHWIHFSTGEQRSEFMRSIVAKGFVPEIQATSDYEEFPFTLKVSRQDCTSEENIEEVVLFLWELAQESEGEYDGWETLVMREREKE